MVDGTRLAVGVLLVAAAGLGACQTRRDRAACASVAAAPSTVPQMFVDVSIVRVDRAAADALLGETQPAGGVSRRTLSAAEADALLERLRALPGAEVVAAPKILALEGQQGTIFVGEYAAEPGGLTFEVEEEGGLARAGSHGLSFTVTPRREGTLGRIAADLRFAWKSAAGAATEPVTTLSTRASLFRDERGVWSLPVASSRPGARDRIVLVLSMRLLEV